MAFEIKRKAWHRLTAERVKLLAGAARIISAIRQAANESSLS
jgi:hypothetical protein